MAKSKIENSAFELELTDTVATFFDDPAGFAAFAFEWGTGDLDGHDGLDTWQNDQLERVRQDIMAGPEEYVIREAVTSGHGSGKSAITAIIILWAMSTRPHLSGVITANTTSQLTTKTWRELALWHKRAINAHWFSWSATSFKHVDHPETWACHAIPNSEHNSEAFAGLHAEHVLVIMDEASAIPDVIYEVAQGALTTPKAMMFLYGNPTKNTGFFRECWGTEAHRWSTDQIDTRTCKMTNKTELSEWIETYGIDSDFVRVRILGQFPRTSSMQFNDTNMVDMAMARDIPADEVAHMPVVLSVDVARYGDDQSVIVARQGRKVLQIAKFREKNTMELAYEVMLAAKALNPGVTFVDEVGVGGGVVDRLNMLGLEVIGVNAGTRADDPRTFKNKRTEMFSKLRDWLVNADIPADRELRKELIGMEYGYVSGTGGRYGDTIMLEKKSDMKKRGIGSPDIADALAYSFAEDLGDCFRTDFEPEDSFTPK